LLRCNIREGASLLPPPVSRLCGDACVTHASLGIGRQSVNAMTSRLKISASTVLT
jgi:hypothetical protein